MYYKQRESDPVAAKAHNDNQKRQAADRLRANAEARKRHGNT